MSPFVVVLKEPKPLRLRLVARKRWNKKRAMYQAIIDSAYTPEMDDKIRKASIDLLLYGEAYLDV